MAGYENEYSSFPDKKIVLHQFKNIDDSIAPIISEINLLKAAGNYSGASSLIKENASILSQYIVDAETFRTWEEEIYNTQVYAKQALQSVFFDVEEPECQANDVWVGGF